MVKIDLGKRDVVWIGLIIVLIGVGFGYAYTTDGSGNPAVMGHSVDEIDFEVEIFEAPPRDYSEHKFTNVGRWTFCALSAIGDMDNQEHCWVERNNDSSWEIHTMDKVGAGDYTYTRCFMVCFR